VSTSRTSALVAPVFSALALPDLNEVHLAAKEAREIRKL
jgi:hypothetical protein